MRVKFEVNSFLVTSGTGVNQLFITNTHVLGVPFLEKLTRAVSFKMLGPIFGRLGPKCFY